MRQILTIAYYELVHILKDRILFLLVFAVPLGYTALFGSVYITATLTGIPLGIVDLDNSRLSREVVTAFENNPNFEIKQDVNTYPRLEEAMKDGTVRAGIVIPENFFEKAAQNRQTDILTVYDSSNLVWGYNIRKAAQEVISTINTNHTAAYLAGLGIPQHQVIDILNTVTLNYEVWYNPTFSYATFLFMGLVMMIIHQIGLLSAGIAVTRDKANNCWLQYIYSPIPQWKIFLGKTLPYFIANFFNYSLLIWFSNRIIHVKTGGSLPLIILLGLLYTLIIISAGFCISVRAANSLQVTRYLMLLSVPFFIISGYSWPTSHIPDFVNGIARMLPFTWMAEGFKLVTLKELGLPYIVKNLLALSVMAILTLYLALTFNKRRKPPQEDGLEINSGNSFPQK
ncbi:ABC transporter permease [Desulfolucanica intricata]|uniref:ABC transporter permease n=1 Tax=Desulfolucanica intricata TaxID=1285191 RepID=UPI00082A203B|nr:ABC transporter permease [Desulfolucanica intricata]